MLPLFPPNVVHVTVIISSEHILCVYTRALLITFAFRYYIFCHSNKLYGKRHLTSQFKTKTERISGYLNARFGKTDFGGHLLSHEDVWVSRLSEEIFEYVELLSRERCPLAPLLPIQRCSTTYHAHSHEQRSHYRGFTTNSLTTIRHRVCL